MSGYVYLQSGACGLLGIFRGEWNRGDQNEGEDERHLFSTFTVEPGYTVINDARTNYGV